MNRLDTKIQSIIRQVDGKWGIYACELETGQAIYELDADLAFPAASVNKVPIALYVFDQVGKGSVKFDERIKLTQKVKMGGSGLLNILNDGLELTLLDVVKMMLIISDNTAAKILIKKFNPENINNYLNLIGLTTTQLKIDGELFGFGMTTPKEISRVLAGIYNCTFLNSDLSDQLISIMLRCESNDRIKRYLPFDPYVDRFNLKIANKTGSIPGVRNDVAIVLAPKPYAITIFSKDLSDDTSNTDHPAVLATAQISKAIYDSISQ